MAQAACPVRPRATARPLPSPDFRLRAAGVTACQGPPSPSADRPGDQLLSSRVPSLLGRTQHRSFSDFFLPTNYPPTILKKKKKKKRKDSNCVLIKLQIALLDFKGSDWPKPTHQRGHYVVRAAGRPGAAVITGAPRPGRGQQVNDLHCVEVVPTPEGTPEAGMMGSPSVRRARRVLGTSRHWTSTALGTPTEGLPRVWLPTLTPQHLGLALGTR